MFYQKQAVLGPLEPSGFQHTVELGLIKAYDWSPEQVACSLPADSKFGLLVTDKQYSHIPLVKEIKASNGVHTYAWIYQVDHSNCR